MPYLYRASFMYCRCEGIVSWPLIRPCSSVLTGCLKSLISHQCLAHVHLLGGHIYFFVLFFVITARLVMVKQVRIVAPGNLRKIEYFKTQSFYDLMFFLHPKNKFFWKLPPGWRLSETFFLNVVCLDRQKLEDSARSSHRSLPPKLWCYRPWFISLKETGVV